MAGESGCTNERQSCTPYGSTPVRHVCCSAVAKFLADRVCFNYRDTTSSLQSYFQLHLESQNYYQLPVMCDESLCPRDTTEEVEPRGGEEACQGFETYTSASGTLSIKLDNSPGAARNCSFLIMPEWFYSQAEGQPRGEYTKVTQNRNTYVPGKLLPPPMVVPVPSISASVAFQLYSSWQPECYGALVGRSWALTTALCCEKLKVPNMPYAAITSDNYWRSIQRYVSLLANVCAPVREA